MVVASVNPVVAWWLVLLLGLAVVVLGWLLLRTAVAVRRLRRAAEALAEERPSGRLTVRGPLQVSALSAALTRTSRRQAERLARAVRQRNELGAVLESMAEGVLTVDRDERVLSTNPAGARMLGLDVDRAAGRSLQEAVRSTSLQRFVATALAAQGPLQGEMTLRCEAARSGEAPGYVQLQSAPLLDDRGGRVGVVVVLHDVTALRRLESVRRDFVANVSHEVKTPVAAVKAAVETLLDGAMSDPRHAERFLQMIARQAGRLEAIVEDLLSLARIEQEATRPAAQLEPQSLASAVLGARETCQSKAEAADIRVEVDVPGELWAMTKVPLLEQALTNLLDNAIKYSPGGTLVRVTGRRLGDEVVVEVQDQGRGIESVHLPRIFERFYRTDRARSRAMGGTGLGLSIVKHVAEVHGGRVSVDSQPGEGSIFRLHLKPAAAQPTTVSV